MMGNKNNGEKLRKLLNIRQMKMMFFRYIPNFTFLTSKNCIGSDKMITTGDVSNCIDFMSIWVYKAKSTNVHSKLNSPVLIRLYVTPIGESQQNKPYSKLIAKWGAKIEHWHAVTRSCHRSKAIHCRVFAPSGCTCSIRGFRRQEQTDRCIGVGAIKMTRDRVNWGGAAPMQLGEGLHNWLQREAATDVLSGLAFPPSFWFW